MLNRYTNNQHFNELEEPANYSPNNRENVGGRRRDVEMLMPLAISFLRVNLTTQTLTTTQS